MAVLNHFNFGYVGFPEIYEEKFRSPIIIRSLSLNTGIKFHYLHQDREQARFFFLH
jgi:hypothetical protein